MSKPKLLPLFDPLDRMEQEAHAPRKTHRLQLVEAREAKNAAIEQVERNAKKEWLEAFLRAYRVTARQKLRFSADDVWDTFLADYPTPLTHNPKAAGAVAVRAMKEKVIVSVVNMFWKSRRKSCHNRPIQVYQSLIFKGGDE